VVDRSNRDGHGGHDTRRMDRSATGSGMQARR
jgi:hypothetical protein